MITIEEAIKSKKPYVYLLCYPDKTPFYIGKGTNKRAYAHLKEARQTENESEKLNTIREIWEQEQDVIILIDSLLQLSPHFVAVYMAYGEDTVSQKLFSNRFYATCL